MKFIVAFTVLLMGTTSAFTAPNSHRAAFHRASPLAMSSEQKTKVQKDVDAASFEGNEKDALDKLKREDEALQADSPNLEDLLASQLLGSLSMYAFAKMRDFVRNNDDKDWYRPELILTQTGTKDDSIDFHRYLRYPVSAAAQYEFVASNWELLKDCEDINTDETSYYNMRDVLDRLHRKVNLNIVEFDDQFADKDLVYGITVNRTNKRITVLFRGSVVGGKDWSTNAKAFYKTLEPTPVLKDAKLTKEIKVHSGFQSYLFAEQECAITSEITEKFDQIVDNIRGLYAQDEFKGYNFGITGHSLGGALTQLLAYHLASSEAIKDIIPNRPITAISFASPQVGNEGYNQAFQELERKGLVHHLRISNQGDVVPVGPFGWGYTQTGLHMHLKSNERREMDVGYRNLNSQVSQINLDAGANHSLERYYQRLMVDKNKPILASDTIGSLYEKYAGDYTE